jgi:hypothetical protein
MDVMEVIEYVKEHMLGRIADEQGNTALMAQTTLCDGDHLEIGTLHGGSAIVVALLKKRYGFTGRVVCVDPLDGYYTGTRYAFPVDFVSKVPVSLETIRENERRFGVELEIVRARSIPFPLHGRRFATAYIDGDHWGDVPLMDFINAAWITDKYITFDNCGAKWPDVTRACGIAEWVWQPYKREGIACIVRHP